MKRDEKGRKGVYGYRARPVKAKAMKRLEAILEPLRGRRRPAPATDLLDTLGPSSYRLAVVI